LAKDLLSLRKNEVINSFTFGGTYCLSRYTDEPNILTGNVVINIAPPWGQIMVFPHQAGNGACATILCQTMGPKTTLKVDYWHRLEAGEYQDFDNIAKTAYSEIQLLQAGVAYKVDNSPEWDTLLSMRLRGLGIRSETQEIKLGQAILMPPAQFYGYKFYHHIANDNNTTPCMLISAFGDFMGDDAHSFDRNFWSLYRLRKNSVEIVESIMKILFGAIAEFKYKRSDNVCKEHARAAIGILKELILRQDLRNITWNHKLFRDVQQMLDLNPRNDSQPQASQHVIWLDPPGEGYSVNGNKRKLEQTEISSADPPAKRRNATFSTDSNIKENAEEVNLNDDGVALTDSTGNLTEDEELIDLNS
jgi:hypothetical protein